MEECHFHMHKKNDNTFVLTMLHRTFCKKTFKEEQKAIYCPKTRQFNVTQIFRQGNYTWHGGKVQYETKNSDTMQNSERDTLIKDLAFFPTDDLRKVV